MGRNLRTFDIKRDPNKKDIFVSYNRSYTSKYIDHTLKVYSYWLNIFKNDYNIILLSQPYENNFINKFCSYIEIFDGWVAFSDPKYNSWNEYREYYSDCIKKIENLYNPILFIELGGHLNTIFKRRREKQWDIAMSQNKNLRFLSVKKCALINLYSILFVKHFKLQYNHFLIDSQECDYSKFTEMNGVSYKRFFGYSSSSVNFEFHPFLRMYYSSVKNFSFQKKYDWLIGFAILTTDRKWLSQYYDYFKNLPGESRIYLKDKYNNIDTFISKDKYMIELQEAKQTLILPPYDKDFFSLIRFLESIAVGTVPRIHSSVFIDEIINLDTNDIIKDLIIDNKILEIDLKETMEKLKDFVIEQKGDKENARNLVF